MSEGKITKSQWLQAAEIYYRERLARLECKYIKRQLDKEKKIIEKELEVFKVDE